MEYSNIDVPAIHLTNFFSHLVYEFYKLINSFFIQNILIINFFTPKKIFSDLVNLIIFFEKLYEIKIIKKLKMFFLINLLILKNLLIK